MISHREKLLFHSIQSNVDVKSAKEVFGFLADVFAPEMTKDKAIIQQLFLGQETMSSSGIGHGIALPHLQIDGLKNPLCVLMKLKNPISYNGVDDEPVDIICALISPSEDGPHHLRRLSRFSRLFRDDKFCTAIREEQSPQKIQSLFLDWQTQMLRAA